MIFQKYQKKDFSSISLGHSIKHKLFIPEEWPFEIQTFLSSFNFFSWPHLSYICTLGLFYFCFELFCYFLMPLTKFYQTWSIEKKPSITIVGEVYCVLLPNHTYLRTFPLLFLKQTPSNWIIISVTISYRFFL